MTEPRLVPVNDKHGRTVWQHEPPEHCPEGHPWHVGSGTYGEGWFGCWCPGAQKAGGRPGHVIFTCHICNGQVLMPQCVDPTLKVGWGGSHS
jgi:hypothetical protein